MKEDLEEVKKKQTLLQEEIIDKNYDKTSFINFCLDKKEDGDDINNYTLKELKKIVSEFQQKYYNPSEYNKIKRFMMRIYIQQEGFLDNKNFYLIFNYMGKNEQIKYKKNCPYEISYNIEAKDLLPENKINVSIFESGFFKSKFKGDFDIKLSEVELKKEFSQKCKIRSEAKGKDVYSTVVIKLEPQYENIEQKK